MKRPTLYYIRHGQTDWNAEQRFQGRKDIPLNALGRAQAKANGEKLASLLPEPSLLSYSSSPLGRARETMEIIRDALGLNPAGYEIDARLIEASYGDLEGTTLAEFKAANPAAHRLRKETRWTFTPPNGESHAMVLPRINAWYQSISKDSVIVAHGVVGRVLRQHLLGLDPNEAADYEFPQDRIFIWDGVSEKLV
jgi:probable phosphoglycerate mutase